MITGYVRRQALAVSAPVLVADTIDYLTARFVFMTGDWDGLEVWAHFRQGDTAYDFRLDEDGEITSDQHFNLTEGVWSVYLTGHLYSGGAMLQRISTQVAEVEVVKSGLVNANPFPPIPATVEEQIFAELADHEERLSDVEQNGTGGGTGDITGAVRYDVLQELTDEQQMQARSNTGAASKVDVDKQFTEISSAIENLDVQPDWNQNDETAPDYVKNRPFYEETKELWNYDEAVELSNGDGGQMTDLIKQNFVEGSIVKVLINGETYICTVYKKFADFFVGNSSLSPMGGEDTGEPFAIWYDGWTTMYFTSNNSDIVNFATDVTVYKPIPGQYLPTGDNCPYVEKSNFNVDDYNNFYGQKNKLLKWVEIATVGANYNTTIFVENFDTVGHSEELVHSAVYENISICNHTYANKSNVPYIFFNVFIKNNGMGNNRYTCNVPMTLVYTENKTKIFTGNFITPEYYLFALVLRVYETSSKEVTTTMTLKRIV